MRFLANLWNNSAVGLDISTDSVRVVELTRIFKKIRLLRFGEEKIDSLSSIEEDVVNAIHALFTKLKIKQKEVVVHLGSSMVRHFILESPIPLPEDLPAWIHEQILKSFPATLRPSRLAVFYHVISNSDKNLKIMAACCKSSLLEERISLIEKADLKPVMVGGGAMDIFQAYVFEDNNIFKETVCFIELRRKQINFLVTLNGSPCFYRYLNLESENPQQILDQSLYVKWVNRVLNKEIFAEFSPINEILVVGDAATEELVGKFDLSAANVKVGYPLHGLIKKNFTLSPEYSLAAGLAVKNYFPLLNTIDFLPDDRKSTFKKNREKQKALRFVSGFGAVFFIVLFILNVAKAILSNKLEKVEKEVSHYNEQIMAIEQVKKEQRKLHRALREMQQLVTERSRYSEILEEISRIVPRGAWLEKFVSKPQSRSVSKKTKTRGNIVLISGWAFDEESVAAFIARLESCSYFGKVQLIGTKRVSAKEVWKRTRLKKIPLINFSISMRLTNE